MEKLFANNLHSSISLEKDVFGKFIGKWKLDLAITSMNGKVNNYKGEWHFNRILQGRAIQDIWIIPGLDRTDFHEYGTTVRTFDNDTEKWKAVWFGPIQNQLFEFDVDKINSDIVLNEVGKLPFKMKWSFYNIQENSCEWKSEIKPPAAKDWFTNYHMQLNRKE